MPKMIRLRSVMDIWCVKRSETVLTSSWQYFCQIFWWLWKKISSKSSFSVVCEILRLLVNILTPDDKYYFSVKTSVWTNRFKWNYLEIETYFSIFFYISEICKNCEHFEENMSLRGDLFLTLLTAKSGVT